MGCGSGSDPDGRLQVKIRDGTLTDATGASRGFAGKGTDDGKNEVGSMVFVPVFASGLIDRWAVLFSPPLQTTWIDLEPGSYGGSDTVSFELGLGCLGDFQGVPAPEFETCVQIDAISVATSSFEVDSVDDSLLEGSFVASFVDGSTLDASIEIRGLAPPVEDEDPIGGPNACSTFSDSTPYFGDMQLDAQCWAAGSYQACDNEQGRAASCAALQGTVDCCYTGSGSCPYC